MAEGTLNSRATMSHRIADKLEKPQLDNRTYRVIELPNKLEVLLIHDPETDKASAAMDVNVGSFSDSDDLPGMAHAVEHLLFMGTEKFPGENDYNQYLQKYGGYSNAFTASTDTNYYFELSASSTSSGQATTNGAAVDKSQAPLYGALDRFAQFFIKPLFLADTLDRELRAVDSENKKNLQSDNWRLHQLNKSLANKKHPFNKFSTGNYKVLHDDPIARGVAIRDAFMDFYKRHYSANRMKLAVLGREDLDTLEIWVTEFFAEVPNQDLQKLRWDDIPAYSEHELATQIFAKPVMEMRDLDIYFVYPDEEELWETHPGRYISHLIGHEGPGSLLAYLKTKGWANGLGAGPFPICPGGALFSISIHLTKDGLTHYKEVVKTLFQYIAMIKDQPPQEWIVEEMKQLAEVDFRFRQKIPASRTTSSLVGVMQKPYPRDKLLSAQSLIWRFDPKAIKRGLDHLTPDNFRLTLVAQDFPGDWDQKEKWYGTEYKYEKIPKDFLEEIKKVYKQPKSDRPAELHLPAKNEFIPTNLEVEKKTVEKPALTPKLVRNDARVRTWWKKDDQFWAPKANVYVVLRSPIVQTSAMTAVMTQMFKSLVEDSLTEYAYDAELAGLEYSIQNHTQGLDIVVSGYNDKMHVLLEKVLVSVRDLVVKDDRFEIIKERVLRTMRNFDYQQPFHQISTYSRYLVSEKGYVNQQLLDELPSITADDIRRFAPQILAQMHIEILAHGNLYREDALRLTDIVESTLHGKVLPPSQWPIRRSLLVPQGSNYVYKRTLKDPANVNHCIDYILFTNLNSDRTTRAKLLLFAQMADEPVFDTLRSKEQLGYVVSSSTIALATVSGWRVLIQSERTPEYLEKRIDIFLTKFGDTIREMKQEDFDSFKIALINKRLEKLKNLNQETARFWHHITNEVFDFELVHRDVEEIEKLTKEDLTQFFDTFISPASDKRARAAVHLLAQTSSEELAEKTDPAEKTAKVNDALDQLLNQLSISSDRSQLQKRITDLPSSDLNTKSITTALSSHLTEDAKTPSADVEGVIAQITPALEQALPQLCVANTTAKEGEADSSDVKLPKTKEATVIEDVRLFKASLAVTEGAMPVRDIKELEDREAKL
ncbi:Metalloenzyme, LuxS/M16 peptidase-like protein [Elsinoe ampelina]|uniref:Metalloenzyme, LuxS/M16 peptidase-like protein n=1 Tax=Elsinoe ampelina TaxID=302913 RepID=A0A6A6G4K6_9PEZI|nr:Metalloenzyme, LuxS/M16 peptidase-like protein [Elsinoe ampelina]